MIDSDSSDSPEETSVSATEGSSGPPPDPSPSSSSESALVSGGSLTDEGKREVARWISEGLGLSDVQKKLADEHGLTLTYMETRFLVDDLELALQDPEPEPEPAIAEGGEGSPSAENEELEGASASEGGVSVEVDKVMRPGALASGAVTFPDGVTMQWQLDQFGRLAITPKEGYQPSEENLMAFQQQVQVELRKAGF